MKQKPSAGFTIIELMIATVVFSIVLLTISAAIIQIGRLYYKGITSAQTQEVTRSVIAGITDSIQFNSGQNIGAVNPNADDASSKAICINTQHYSYKLGVQRKDKQHALVLHKVDSGCSATPAQDLRPNSATPIEGDELLGENMRLSKLSVDYDAASDMYRVTVGVVYGDNDLLCTPDIPGSCEDTTELRNDDQILPNAGTLRCKNIRSGTQFCAVSELSTMVERRLTQ
ncbi:MAG: hypothetical protein JWN82_631 [Candidatus Saccharibacteria bacterium]|nr:hypothetical protein [Candidatus Saccharibacteria bacterium]